jgi:predicted chitinase
MGNNTVSNQAIGLHQGSKGEDVRALQEALSHKGFNPGKADGDFGPATKAALINFQKSENLAVTGSVDAATAAALEIQPIAHPDDRAHFTVDLVYKTMFKSSPRANVEKYLPAVLNALAEVNLADKPMILMALATIRTESGSFAPISEYQSTFNTPPGGVPYSLYDFRKDLGNHAKGDGSLFKGRGFIQLTGRNNYAFYSKILNLGTQLVDHPDMANDPVIAARLLAQFLKRHEVQIRNALHESPADLRTARRLVNGGSHGLQVFEVAFNAGEAAIA